MFVTGHPIIDGHFPSSKNGIDSIAGGLSLLSLVPIFFCWSFRKIHKNRQTICDFLGLKCAPPKSKHPDEFVIIWENVGLFVGAHLSALFAFYLICTSAMWKTALWALTLHAVSIYSIPGGAHKLYSHRSFKPSKLYEIIIMIFNTVSLQNDLIHWARDHRCHHKFTDTNADPTSGARGLLFAHVGWLLVERHPDVIKKGKQIDCSDLFNNPILRFQRKYYPLLVVLLHYLIPIAFPVYLWGERFWSSYFISVSFPWCLSLNVVGFVNSVSHWRGTKNYNKNISASDLPTFPFQIIMQGEAQHNFHHVFPRDYYGGEKATPFHISGNIIKLCSWLGLTWDLNTASPQLIERTKKNNGAKMEMNY